MDLAALDRRVAPESLADRFGKRLGAVDDEQPANLRIKTALDQVVQQGLRHGGVLRRPLDHTEGMLAALAVNANGGQKRQVVLDVDPVDLDDQKIQLGQIRRHPFLHARGRQRHEAAGHRRFGHTRTAGRADAAFRQADRTAVLARRDVDQHQVHRPFTQQVIGHSLLPARQGHLCPVASAYPGPLKLDLAAMEAQFPFGLPPAMPGLAVLSPIAGTAELDSIFFHHAR